VGEEEGRKKEEREEEDHAGHAVTGLVLAWREAGY